MTQTSLLHWPYDWQPPRHVTHVFKGPLHDVVWTWDGTARCVVFDNDRQTNITECIHVEKCTIMGLGGA